MKNLKKSKSLIYMILFYVGALISSSLCITFGYFADKFNTYEMELQIEKFGFYDSNVVVDMTNNYNLNLYNSFVGIFFIIALACWIMGCVFLYFDANERNKNGSSKSIG